MLLWSSTYNRDLSRYSKWQKALGNYYLHSSASTHNLSQTFTSTAASNQHCFLPSQDWPHLYPEPTLPSNIRLSLIPSWGTSPDAHRMSLPKFVWILTLHTCKYLQGDLDLHWLSMLQKGAFSPPFLKCFQQFETPQSFKMLRQRMKATEM